MWAYAICEVSRHGQSDQGPRDVVEAMQVHPEVAHVRGVWTRAPSLDAYPTADVCVRNLRPDQFPPNVHMGPLCSSHRPVGLMDKASASGAGDSRFESWAGHFERVG